MRQSNHRTVSAGEFRRDFERLAGEVQSNGGPITVTRHGEIIGAYVGPDVRAAIMSDDVKRLLRERLNSRQITISHAQAMAEIRESLRRRA